MASGPAAGLDLRYARIGAAAFALARRICGDMAVAAGVVEQAFATSGDEAGGAVGDGLLLRRVRALAWAARRPAAREARALAQPPALSGLTALQWQVLELVALRGAAVRVAAEQLGLPEAVVLAQLHDGLRRAGSLLSVAGAREADDHSQTPRLALLG
jgi:hypothetical protein